MTLIPFIYHSIPLLRFPFYRTAKIQKFLIPTTFISKNFKIFLLYLLKCFLIFMLIKKLFCAYL